MDKHFFIKKFINECEGSYLAMKNCSHHYDGFDHASDDRVFSLNPYHLEGDIWSHTCLVYQNVMQVAHMFPYNEIGQLAAILHDTGKPLARDEKHETQRVRFFGHEGFSFYIACEIMNKWGINDKIKIPTLKLVNLHGNFDWFKKGNIKLLVDKFNKEENLFRYLNAFMNCDHMGRFHDDADHMDNGLDTEDYVEFMSKSMEVKNEKHAHAPVMTILVGPPGCGKTTWRKENVTTEVVVSRDDVLMNVATEGTAKNITYRQAWEKVDQKKVDEKLQGLYREAINQEDDIIVDMTNMSAKSRRKWVNTVPKNYKKVAVIFTTGIDTLRKRNNEREGKQIPNHVLNNMMSSLSIPLYDEVDEIIWE